MTPDDYYWQAWLQHGGGPHGRMFQGRPSLSDFGKWSKRFHAHDPDRRSMTLCGIGIPAPHNCYQYATESHPPQGFPNEVPQGRCQRCERVAVARAKVAA